MMKTIIEPFKIKSVESIRINTKKERLDLIKKADYNLFQLRSNDVIIDLLTDSGTGAMSSSQWAGIMLGDESYAGSNSYLRFKSCLDDVFGFKYVLPTHQGRAAERILFSVMCDENSIVLSNTHFDTTRANVEATGAKAIDLIPEKYKNTQNEDLFKGNICHDKLKNAILKYKNRIPLVILTITNNSGGGQPVSMANIRDTKKILEKYNIPLYIDACRFAENAYFIKTRETGYSDISIEDIVKEMFSYADGCTMSAKKDGIANIGGFLCTNDKSIAYKNKNLLILTEGFPTYGGLAGRDLDAIAIGIKEAMDIDYLHYRIKSTSYLGNKLIEYGVPILRPPGGHAIYIDASLFLNHLNNFDYPGQALACELYVEGGIRTSEIGSLMFGGTDKDGNITYSDYELVRLAIPRRTYTQSHIDYVIEIICAVFDNKEKIRGLKIIEEPQFLRHFSAKLETK